MAEPVGTHRPQIRNLQLTHLYRYRLPWAGVVSFLHRISGLLLFLGTPFLLYLFQNSLATESTFASYKAVVSHWSAKLVLLGLIWAFVHHALAGIRFLLLDLHVGIGKDAASLSARVVLIAGIAVTLVLALKLFGAF